VRRLTDQERIILREVGPEGEGPVTDSTFEECIRQGWGYWENDGERDSYWKVTPSGRKALELDNAARNISE
jgi:hypothetical protein